MEWITGERLIIGMQRDGSDEMLFADYLSGNEVSFEILLNRYGDRIIRFIAVHIEDPQDAEDLMIESFARIVAYRPRLREEGTFRSYLFKTARTVAIRYNKEYRKHHHLDIDELLEEPCDHNDHFADVYREERRKIIRHCMDKLNPDYSEVLRLKYFEELNTEQIGKIMHKNKKSVENILRRARQALSKLIEKEDLGDSI